MPGLTSIWHTNEKGAGPRFPGRCTPTFEGGNRHCDTCPTTVLSTTRMEYAPPRRALPAWRSYEARTFLPAPFFVDSIITIDISRVVTAAAKEGAGRSPKEQTSIFRHARMHFKSECTDKRKEYRTYALRPMPYFPFFIGNRTVTTVPLFSLLFKLIDPPSVPITILLI